MFSLATIAFGLAFFQKPPTTDLRPETLELFDEHVSRREMGMRIGRVQSGKLLWVDDDPDRVRRVRAGEVIVEPRTGKGAFDIRGGMVHDWIGASFIPNSTLHHVLARIKNYDNHKNAYQPEVVDSRLMKKDGEHYHIYLRLVKKKVITVVLNTEHDVRYHQLDPHRVHSRSVTTKIAEVDSPGTPAEHELPSGHDHGFLWRLNSYWRFQERDGGVYVECEAISLTRGIPTGLGWLISPIVRDLPRESLTRTLDATRVYVN